MADAVGREQDEVRATHQTRQPRYVVVDAAVVMQQLAGAALDQRAPVRDLSLPRADHEDARATEI
jgi:hypothetical protein